MCLIRRVLCETVLCFLNDNPLCFKHRSNSIKSVGLCDLRYIVDEFLCDYETKIKMSQKCDGVYDCMGSDEHEWICEYL